MLTSAVAALALLPAALIPKPNRVTVGGANLQLPIDTVLSAPASAKSEALALRNWLGGRTPWVPDANLAGIRLTLKKSLAGDLGAEGYRLNVDQVGVRIEAATSAGLYYGCQTLRQIAQHDDNSIVIPQVEIQDSPRFVWRGFMLDCARHFWPKEFIERVLDQMAALKMNRFHWHLCDDQGWRLEILKYPRLTLIGSQRLGTKGRSDTSDGIPYGGFYSQDQVREIVAYATARHIEVIPEIEMPGHCTAALAAYPEYSCKGGPFEVGQKWGLYPDVFCAGQDKTFEFLKDILEEVMDMFPSRYIHLGGDEVIKDRWQTCPRCRARMQSEGLKDVNQLQGYFMGRISTFLVNRGRQFLGWDEILEGGLPQHATVMSWRGRQGGIDAAKIGHDVVMTPSDYCYLDHYQGDPKNEPPAVGGFLPLRQTYAFDPIPAVLKPDQAKHILGLQGNLWTEYIDSEARAEYMIFPRLLALAEVGWTSQNQRDYSDFLSRLPNALRMLDDDGIRYRPLGDDASTATVGPKGGMAKASIPKSRKSKAR